MEIYIRDIGHPHSPFLFGTDIGWQRAGVFQVPDLAKLNEVFNQYYKDLGLYKRVAFWVEEWIWTAEAGYETMDYC